MRIMKTTAAVLALLTGSVAAQAGFFDDVGRDARQRGMANAGLSLYWGVNSLHYNPAGTAHAKSFELTPNWNKPLTMGDLNDGTSFSQLGFTMLMPFTNDLNLSWLLRWLPWMLTFGNEAFLFKDGAFGVSFDQLDTGRTTERLITMNYAKVLDDVLFKGARLSIGFNFDFYMLGITANEDTGGLPNLSKFTFGMDFGAIYNFSDNLQLAIVFENFLKPNYSIFPDGEGDYQAMNVKMGGSLFYDKLLFFENLTIAFTYMTFGRYDAADNTASKTAYNLGFESWWFENIFAFRGGVTIGSDEASELATGITLRVPMGKHLISLDYAFTMPLGVSGTRHMLQLTWRWDLPKHVFEHDKAKAAEMKRLAELEEKQREGGQPLDQKKDETKTDGKTPADKTKADPKADPKKTK